VSKYLAIDRGDYSCTNSHRVVASWLRVLTFVEMVSIEQVCQGLTWKVLIADPMTIVYTT